MSGESKSGCCIDTPSVPSTIISIVAFPRIAPGANSIVQPAVACVPLIAFAPVAFSNIQPVSSTPSLGHDVLFPPSCALANGADKIGPKEDNNIMVTSNKARAPVFAGPTALLSSFIYCIGLQWYIKRMHSC